MTAEQRRLRFAEVKFRQRVERQREARAREEQQQHRSDDDDPEPETPAPATRWERFGGTGRLRPTTTSMSGTNPDIDRVLAQKFGSRISSAQRVREAEERLHARLSGQLDDKVPLSQRPEEVAHPRCPVDGVPLQVVSYTASMKPAERRCPVCRRTEKEFTERGISLESPAEGVREAMEHGGLRKKPAYSPVEQAVRSLIRKW
jgi:rubrerythrin